MMFVSIILLAQLLTRTSSEDLLTNFRNEFMNILISTAEYCNYFKLFSVCAYGFEASIYIYCQEMAT